MTSRQRFLDACACRPLPRPPLWVMRQAGRYLPEYRELKTRHSFLEMVKTPELATEVTLQPLRRFRLDAAILFSDILVIPEALGVGYHFRDQGGIAMERQLRSFQEIEKLAPAEAIHERLGYVFETLRILRRELAENTALLGFGGSPWTLACYMVDGGSSDDFVATKSLFHSAPKAFNALMEKLTCALSAYFLRQIEAGADAIQIFDSWGGILAGSDYNEASLKWIRAIIGQLPKDFPVILYAKGTAAHLVDQGFCGARVISVDWTQNLRNVRELLPNNVAVQGNLDPVLMNLAPEIVTREANKLLESMAGYRGHIMNLGHGIMPQARIESMEALVHCVCSWNEGPSA